MVRTFRKLRLSLTDACNFRCVYCVTDDENVPQRPQTGLADFVRWVSAIHEVNPLREVRLTGGEPTLYRDLVPLVAELKKLQIPRIAMTTNGSALTRFISPLVAAGLHSVNISVDAIDPTVFRMLGGKSPEAVFAGVDAALGQGIEVKINTTLLAEVNDSQILPLLGWAMAKKVPIRFLELMAMGHLHDERSARLVSAQQILDVVGEAFVFRVLPREPHATAHYYELQNGYRFGIIGNSSLPFCADCDRLRLDSRGNLYGCLSSAQGIPVGTVATDMASALSAAMVMKQRERFTGSSLVMREIGG